MKVLITLKHQWDAIEMKVPECEGEKLRRIVEDKLKAKQFREAMKKAGGEFEMRKII